MAVAAHGIGNVGTDKKALCRGPSGSHSTVAPSSSTQLQEKPSRKPTSSFTFTQRRKFSVALQTEICLSLLCQLMPLSNGFLKRFLISDVPVRSFPKQILVWINFMLWTKFQILLLFFFFTQPRCLFCLFVLLFFPSIYMLQGSES